MRRVKNVLIALDQVINAVLGGWSDETLSSRAYRWHVAGKRHWPMHLIDDVFFDCRHCTDSYESERAGRQLPPELRSES
ncbi:MAG: pseudouridine synthase [Candidatus Accumulibacter sp.]|nr:pseudouridine synthase [Accumulibacter sp.]